MGNNNVSIRKFTKVLLADPKAASEAKGQGKDLTELHMQFDRKMVSPQLNC